MMMQGQFSVGLLTGIAPVVNNNRIGVPIDIPPSLGGLLMSRWLLSAVALLLSLAAPAMATEITGQYVEARTCDVYTGPCFANADTGLTGRNGMLAWRIDKGEYDSVRLDGLGVVAVLSASDTLGLRQSRTARSIVIVDEKASPAQRSALVNFAKQRAGDLLGNVISVKSAPVDVNICACKENGCATVKAGDVRVETRCLDKNHDRGCGNEWAYYPPLSKGVIAKPAMAIEHAFSGKDFNETWSDGERRGAYVGTFAVR
jgi:hypothetical protein